MEPRHAARGKISRKRLTRLSEVIIETLKTLSTQQQKLTPESLSEALKGHEEFWQLLQGNGRQTSGPTASGEAEFPAPASAAAPPQSPESDHAPGLRSSFQTSDEADALAEFYRKSILALLTCVQENENKNLTSSVDHMRSLIFSNSTDLEALGNSLQQIKDLIIKEALEPVPSDTARSRGNSSFWNFWQRRSKQQEADHPSETPNFDFRRLQRVFLTIIDELQQGLDEDSLQRFGHLKARFESSQDLDALLEPTEELIGLIQGYIHNETLRREEVVNFVKELGAGLSEMEDQLITSLSHTQETYQLNATFNSSLHGELEDIKESFSITRSFEEARSFVLGKLKAIRSALENKRKQDETHLQHAQQKMGSLQKSFEKMKKEIGQVQKKTRILEQEILLDGLTGIYNRRAYEVRIKDELSRFQRYKQPFSLILFDIDHFKQINDQFGHQAGDKCLREITARIKPVLRQSDFLARYGGEEFIILLPGTAADDACKAAEKVRTLIEKTRFAYQGAEVPVTISLGLTEVATTDQDPEVLFKRVDGAMYQAKKRGRNQTHRI